MKLHLLAAALIAAGIAFSAPAYSQSAASKASQAAKPRSATDANDQVRITRVTPEYCE